MRKMRKRGQIAFAVIILFILAIGIFALIFLSSSDDTVENRNNIKSDDFCSSDIECFPASCCHAASCIPIKNKPVCDGVFCTAVCEPGTLDCGQGSCKCVNNKCKAAIE